MSVDPCICSVHAGAADGICTKCRRLIADLSGGSTSPADDGLRQSPKRISKVYESYVLPIVVTDEFPAVLRHVSEDELRENVRQMVQEIRNTLTEWNNTNVEQKIPETARYGELSNIGRENVDRKLGRVILLGTEIAELDPQKAREVRSRNEHVAVSRTADTKTPAVVLVNAGPEDRYGKAVGFLMGRPFPEKIIGAYAAYAYHTGGDDVAIGRIMKLRKPRYTSVMIPIAATKVPRDFQATYNTIVKMAEKRNVMVVEMSRRDLSRTKRVRARKKPVAIAPYRLVLISRRGSIEGALAYLQKKLMTVKGERKIRKYIRKAAKLRREKPVTDGKGGAGVEADTLADPVKPVGQIMKIRRVQDLFLISDADIRQLPKDLEATMRLLMSMAGKEDPPVEVKKIDAFRLKKFQRLKAMTRPIAVAPNALVLVVVDGSLASALVHLRKKGHRAWSRYIQKARKMGRRSSASGPFVGAGQTGCGCETDGSPADGTSPVEAALYLRRRLYGWQTENVDWKKIRMEGLLDIWSPLNTKIGRTGANVRTIGIDNLTLWRQEAARSVPVALLPPSSIILILINGKYRPAIEYLHQNPQKLDELIQTLRKGRWFYPFRLPAIVDGEHDGGSLDGSVCTGCGTGGCSRFCGECLRPYCSEGCQIADWKRHSDECRPTAGDASGDAPEEDVGSPFLEIPYPRRIGKRYIGLDEFALANATKVEFLTIERSQWPRFYRRLPTLSSRVAVSPGAVVFRYDERERSASELVAKQHLLLDLAIASLKLVKKEGRPPVI